MLESYCELKLPFIQRVYADMKETETKLELFVRTIHQEYTEGWGNLGTHEQNIINSLKHSDVQLPPQTLEIILDKYPDQVLILSSLKAKQFCFTQTIALQLINLLGNISSYQRRRFIYGLLSHVLSETNEFRHDVYFSEAYRKEVVDNKQGPFLLYGNDYPQYITDMLVNVENWNSQVNSFEMTKENQLKMLQQLVYMQSVRSRCPVVFSQITNPIVPPVMCDGTRWWDNTDDVCLEYLKEGSLDPDAYCILTGKSLGDVNLQTI